jgi:hypothetical protein
VVLLSQKLNAKLAMLDAQMHNPGLTALSDAVSYVNVISTVPLERACVALATLTAEGGE